MEWYEALHPFLMFSANIRRWFMDTVFLQHRERFSEYLLECPSTEVGICSACTSELGKELYAVVSENKPANLMDLELYKPVYCNLIECLLFRFVVFLPR